MNIQFKPVKTVVPYQQFKERVAGGGYIVQRKYDGVFGVLSLKNSSGGQTVIAVESVTRKSGLLAVENDIKVIGLYGGFYVPLTLISSNGQSFINEPNEWRLTLLKSVLSSITRTGNVPVVWPDTYNILPEHLPGEGLVAHPADGPWGHMLCCKNRQDYIVEVLKTSDRRSVLAIETEKSRAARGGSVLAHGNIPLYGRAAEMVTCGALLKITALGLTDSGMFREPQLDTDGPGSWLVKL